jgi:hypothetical protein
MELIMLGCLSIVLFFTFSLVVLSDRTMGRLERVFTVAMCAVGEVMGVYAIAYGVVVIERLQHMV